jgi:hypothetical protein
MKQETWKEQWTQAEIRTAIEKTLGNEPDGPNRDYLTTDSTIQDIKEKHGLKKFKPSPLEIVLVRQCCGEKFVHVLANKRGTKSLKDWRCHDPECRRRTTVLPFGKFTGLTVALVYLRLTGEGIRIVVFSILVAPQHSWLQSVSSDRKRLALPDLLRVEVRRPESSQPIDDPADDSRLAAARRPGQEDILRRGSGSVMHTLNLPDAGTPCYDGCGNGTGP